MARLHSLVVTGRITKLRRACLEVPIEGRPGDIQASADIVDRCFALVVELAGKLDLAGSAGKPRSAAFASAGSSGCESCLGALPDDVALELCESSKDMEDELSAGSRGVDLLGETLRAVSERTESVGGFPNRLISASSFTPREGGGGDGSFRRSSRARG